MQEVSVSKWARGGRLVWAGGGQTSSTFQPLIGPPPSYFLFLPQTMSLERVSNPTTKRLGLHAPPCFRAVYSSIVCPSPPSSFPQTMALEIV